MKREAVSTSWPEGEGLLGEGLTTLQKAEHLRGLELFSYLTVEELFRLAEIAGMFKRAAGEVILRENDIANAFFLVLQGKVTLTSRNEGFREVIGPQQPFGLHSVLTQEPLAFTAEAVQDTYALLIGAEDFYNLLSNHPETVVSIFKYFVKKSGLGPRI